MILTDCPGRPICRRYTESESCSPKVIEMNGSSRTTKILILAANPKGTSKLRLDEEVRAIKLRLKLAKGRDDFQIEPEWAVRTGDIQQALLDFQPQIGE